MLSYSALPDARLRTAGEVTSGFFGASVGTYKNAAYFVFRLPYGRTSSRTNLMAVLRERRGTCSSKHAVLAQLAIEQGLPVKLMLGVYLMNARNTPGIRAVLAHYGLAEIPEAHCYLLHDNKRIDVTRAIESPAEPITNFLLEDEILPSQIGSYKISRHQDYLRKWLRSGSVPGVWSFDRLWQVREKCIAALTS